MISDADIEQARLRVRQKATGRPVTMQGSVIRLKQLQMIAIFKRLATLTAHTPIQGKANELLKDAGECIDEITELVLELELAQ